MTQAELKRRANDAYRRQQYEWLAGFEYRAYTERHALAEGHQTFLYAIYCDVGAVKFGLADRPEGRMQGMQSANPRLLTLVAAAPATRELELFVHSELGRHRVRGEWFADTADEVLCVVGMVASAEEQIRDLVAANDGDYLPDATDTLAVWTWRMAELADPLDHDPVGAV